MESKKNPGLKEQFNKNPGFREQLKESLKPLDSLDKKFTQQFALCASNSSVFNTWRKVMKALEISCHGAVWILFLQVCIWFTQTSSTKSVFVNILLAIILDLIFVAVIKATVRRARPPGEKDMFMTFSVDNYSFPSGHASRAVMLAVLGVLREAGFFSTLLLTAWSIAVSGSRVILGRHHIGDVLAGIALGFFEAFLISVVWLSPEASDDLVGFFSFFEMFHAADPDGL